MGNRTFPSPSFSNGILALSSTIERPSKNNPKRASTDTSSLGSESQDTCSRHTAPNDASMASIYKGELAYAFHEARYVI
jgi:hypothetical protein